MDVLEFRYEDTRTRLSKADARFARAVEGAYLELLQGWRELYTVDGGLTWRLDELRVREFEWPENGGNIIVEGEAETGLVKRSITWLLNMVRLYNSYLLAASSIKYAWLIGPLVWRYDHQLCLCLVVLMGWLSLWKLGWCLS
jgi:hypothetical protein